MKTKIWTPARRYRDRWYRGLHPHTRLIYDYLWTEADDAGIWRLGFEDAEARIGFDRLEPRPKIEWVRVFHELNAAPPDEDGASKPMSPPVIHRVDGEHWWLVRFIEFQYGVPFKLRSDGIVQPQHVVVIRALHKHNLLGLFEQYYPGSVPEVAKAGMATYTNPTLPKLPTKEVYQPPKLEEVMDWAEAEGLPEAEVRLFHAHYDAQAWCDNGMRIADRNRLLALWRARYECRRADTPVLDARLQKLNADLLVWAKQMPAKEAKLNTTKLQELKTLYAEELLNRKGNNARK